MNAPVCPEPPTYAFPVNPYIGQMYMGWVWNGSVWLPQPNGPAWNVQVFTSSGLYTPSAGLTFAQVEVLGGGGGGGGALALASIATVIVAAIWFAFYFIVFLPRGVIQ